MAIPADPDLIYQERVRQWAEETLRQFLAAWFIAQRERVIVRIFQAERLTIGAVRDLLPAVFENTMFRVAFERVLGGVTAELVRAGISRVRPVPIAPGIRRGAYGRAVAPRQITVAYRRAELPNINELVQARARSSATRVVRINTVTRRAIREQLRIGLERGYSREQIARGVPSEDYRGIGDVVEMTYRNRDRTIARTELQVINNRSSLQAYEALGYKRVRCYDSAQCGLVGHDNPLKPANQVYNIKAAYIYAISHPNCIRRWVPVIADE